MRALSNKMNNDRADGHYLALPGLNVLVLNVRFLLRHRFLYRLFTFSGKMKIIYRLQVWIFWKMHHGISSFLALHFSVGLFQMPLERLILVKMLATDPLLRNMTKIVCPRWPHVLYFLTISPCIPCWIIVRLLSKSVRFCTRVIPEKKLVTPPLPPLFWLSWHR